MRPFPRHYRWVLGAYAIVGLILWPLPLFNILHAESAAVVAFAAYFVAGLSSLYLLGQGMTVGRVAGAHLAALAVPWAMLTVSALWAPNCGYLTGLLLYGLFAPVTAAFSIGLAYLLSGSRLRRKRAVLIGTGVVISVLGPLYDLGFHPQFYTYNHVFGGVLGPIYDQELALRPGLFVYRGLSLLWALLFFLAGWRLRARERTDVRERAGGWKNAAGTTVVVLLIGCVYFFSAPLGINTPGWSIQRALGAVYSTEHFDIYYDSTSISPHEIMYVALDHEYQYERLAGMLDERVNGRIQSYLYPDPEIKARLTGARLTNVAPVWLSEPQTHVLLSVYDHVFPHELAHVFSREFGLPVLRATLSVGLVEGLAVALEPPDRLPSPHAQVAVAALGRMPPPGQPDLAERLAATLSPFGFWTGRGAVSYTTMGSFVGYLLEVYGPERLKEVYALGNFERVYGKPIGVLAEEWEQYVLNEPVVPSITGPLVERRFSIPSLFEVECPHYVPGYVLAYRDGLNALEAADTLQALTHFEAALEEMPDFPAGLAVWGQVKLGQGRPQEVVARLSVRSGTDSLWSALTTLGDAYAMLEEPERARRAYGEAIHRLPAGSREWQNLLVLRTLVAGRPEVIRVLTAGALPEKRAAALGTLADSEPAASMMRALLLAEAEVFGEAVQVLQRTPAPNSPSLTHSDERALEHQRLEWLGHFAYRAGMPKEAAAYARRAADAWLTVGGVHEAVRLKSLAEKYLWAAALHAPSGPV